MTTKQETTMAFRAITPQQAQWVGNAAAVAGGFVATMGPRLEAGERRTWDHGDLVEAGPCVDLYGRRRDDGTCIDGRGVRHLLMVVPADAGLATEGVAVPAEVVERWRDAAADDLRCSCDDEQRDALQCYLATMAS